ncbi:hypothetical protein FHS01_000086 [Longimicrobium terrae]|uniref:Uncharacterized protein n=1 Tax=Longimicrobium terrae TaxID=1639882 RepID=A0A841GPW0_9BACT|nr:hypothetical protein [Longimicrobium terrae]MBB6069030.1 hypothetical protein [Longimicrobium terrae]
MGLMLDRGSLPDPLLEQLKLPQQTAESLTVLL